MGGKTLSINKDSNDHMCFHHASICFFESDVTPSEPAATTVYFNRVYDIKQTVTVTTPTAQPGSEATLTLTIDQAAGLVWSLREFLLRDPAIDYQLWQPKAPTETNSELDHTAPA